VTAVAGAERVELIGQVTQFGDHRFDPRAQQVAIAGWRYAAIGAFEQRHVEIRFQFLNGFGYRRLGQIQFACRTGNR